MRVRVNFYGVLKEDVGAPQSDIELTAEAPTIEDLIARLVHEHPAIEARLAATAVAVENRVVDRAFALDDGAEVDLLPPVSGGSDVMPTALRTLDELVERARHVGPCRVALAGAENDVALGALAEAAERGVAEAVLIGDASRTRELIGQLPDNGDTLLDTARFVPASDPEEAARAAVGAVRDDDADLLMKGALRTDQLLRAVLDRDEGLRTDRLLSDVLVYEDALSGATRLVGITDGGVNVAPDRDAKAQIIGNAVEVFHRLGFSSPRIALMSATEAVTDAIPSTVDARALTERAEDGEFGESRVYGPLALDNALLAWAAEAKGIESPVAGQADVMVVPSIEAGNLLGKAVKYVGGSTCAHVIMGARAPVLIPSRVESVADKLCSVALGSLMAEDSP